MTEEEFDKRYLTTFTQQQTVAIKMVTGPVLLLAVPGSGKTTVLVNRLGYMTRVCGINPARILTVTYTTAAAGDMKKRYEMLFSEQDHEAPNLQTPDHQTQSSMSEGENLLDYYAYDDIYKGTYAEPEFRTINGICAKIILYYGRKIGKKAFSLFDNERSRLGLIGEIYREITKSFATEADLSQISTLITFIKNNMLNKDEIDALEADSDYPIAGIYQRYSQALRNQGKMDYDDQMIYALEILKRSRDTLEHFRNMYQYICVDEAQDTSKIQHVIISLLAGEQGNLFMVGDEDQSIYGFRAAYPDALLNFENDHPGARVLLMEKNFRSATEIVQAADRFIQLNSMRHKKSMNADRIDQGSVRIIDIKGRGAQYSYLAKVAAGISEKDSLTAVLFRDNESAVPLIDLLERYGTEYRFRNGDLTFFSNRVVSDIRNILMFALDPTNSQLFLQIYYKINTYITKKNAYIAAQQADLLKNNGKTSDDVLTIALQMEGHARGTKISLKSIRTHLENIKQDTPIEALNRIAGPMGYGDYLSRVQISDRKIRILRVIARRESSITDFLNRLDYLQKLIGEKKNNQECKFVLSTIHSSKGLEYDNVYLIDVEDGIFPESIPNLDKAKHDELEQFEEERRLFYVGVTRAKNSLNIFRINGKSEFIADLTGMKSISVDSVQRKNVTKKTQKDQRKSSQKPAQYHSMAFDESGYMIFSRSLGQGMGVVHRKFGEGVISKLDGDMIMIQFDDEERSFNLKILFEKHLLDEM